jgi:acid phosphatase type 7
MPKKIITNPVRLSCLVLVFLQISHIDQTIHAQNGNNTYEPESIFLTWQNDPSTTMTIDWHVLDDTGTASIEYRKMGDSGWSDSVGEKFGFPFSNRVINRVELKELEPDTKYQIRFGADSGIYHFRTMPDRLTRAVRFVAGGDAGGRDQTRPVVRVAATYDPDFIVLGGDLAYANGNPSSVEIWYEFFDIFQSELAGEDNRLVPMVMAIGNHEIWSERQTPENLPLDYYRNLYGLKEGDAPYFNALFAFPGVPEYGVLDFGDYMSWVVLDSGHRVAVAGEQTTWLSQILDDRKERPFVYPVYHVPAFPSYRSFDGETSREIREHWVPLFEKFGVKIAFENHDHTYKRTYPIRNNEISPDDGIVYLGDGAMGINVRQISESPRWYLEKGASQRHIIIGTIDTSGHSFQIVNEQGYLIDKFPIDSNDQTISEEFRARHPSEIIPVVEFKDIEYVSESDSLILVEFFHSTGGENWYSNSGWLTDPVMEWYGISVSNGRISRIYMRDNNLSGELPDQITELSGLRRIYIQNNRKLTGRIPEHLGNLSLMHRLRLSGNGLTGTIPPSLGKMHELEDLLLEHNYLTGEIPRSISDLSRLNILDLSGNRLNGKIPSELGELTTRLQVLDLSDNLLEGSLPQELGNIQGLRYLNVSNNRLTGTIPKKIKELEVLDEFLFDGNDFN